MKTGEEGPGQSGEKRRKAFMKFGPWISPPGVRAVLLRVLSMHLDWERHDGYSVFRARRGQALSAPLEACGVGASTAARQKHAGQRNLAAEARAKRRRDTCSPGSTCNVGQRAFSSAARAWRFSIGRVSTIPDTWSSCRPRRVANVRGTATWHLGGQGQLRGGHAMRGVFCPEVGPAHSAADSGLIQCVEVGNKAVAEPAGMLSRGRYCPLGQALNGSAAALPEACEVSGFRSGGVAEGIREITIRLGLGVQAGIGHGAKSLGP